MGGEEERRKVGEAQNGAALVWREEASRVVVKDRISQRGVSEKPKKEGRTCGRQRKERERGYISIISRERRERERERRAVSEG